MKWAICFRYWVCGCLFFWVACFKYHEGWAQSSPSSVRSPLMGVYCAQGNSGIKGTGNFSEWLGVPILLGHDSMPTVATWEHVRGEEWLLGPWSGWKKENPNRRLVLSVAILPGPVNLSGSVRGTDAHVPVSLEVGAQGVYNGYFKSLAESLVKYGLDDSLLRLGWEMNGNWYTWQVRRGQEEAYAGYWRQIVKTMRAVPGAGKLQFVFNPDIDSSRCDIEKAWPGAEFVDYIGIDIYDVSWLADTYPIPDGASPEDALARRKKVWEWQLGGSRRLKFWSNFAREQGRPLCFPEWGLCTKFVKGHGGGDNPYFVEQMWAFIRDPANNVAFHSYFNYSSPTDQDTNHRISPEPDGSFVTPFPSASAKFQELFGIKR